MNSDQFKGRKGQKRLRELNERIDRILGETNERYQSSDEMSFILRSMPDPMVRLWFVSAYRVLDRHWGGIKDYGFLVPKGSYNVVLNTDNPAFGGNGLTDDGMEHFTNFDPLYEKQDKEWLKLYIPARTAMVLKRNAGK